MIKQLLIFFFCFSTYNISFCQFGEIAVLKTPFEHDQNISATYHEAIAFYQELVSKYKDIQVSSFGMTDSGYPLHEVILTNDGVFTPKEIRANKKAIILINNAIHAGEPCGIDASMMMARDLLTVKSELLDHAAIVIIPVYNIGGSLNRGSHSRANQQGPNAYGFRGNAQNLDLNRDFIKCDSKNAMSFNQLLTKWSPEILIDNHTSNGADYQYVMTIIPTQKDKMNPVLSSYMTQQMLPDLFSKMEQKSYKMTPYVYARSTPDDGIYGFMDYPRYSSGYANLHNCISFMPETHMLKPYIDRVKSTYAFTESMLEHVSQNSAKIIQNKKKADKATIKKIDHDLNWTIDMSKVDSIHFDGFEAGYKKSKISGLDRLFYDHNKPYTKRIAHYNTYKPTLTVEMPKGYIIPQAYSKIIERMKNNGVEFNRLKEDEIITVETYKILDYDSPQMPYEGHYIHRKIAVEKIRIPVQYRKGDYILKTNQKMNNYIVQTLEPHAPDSWFAWNFFDGILMQKEHFSAYVFEDLAEQFLKENPSVKKELEDKKKTDPEFAQNGRAQLNFIYKRSPHYEPTFLRYPVGRLIP